MTDAPRWKKTLDVNGNTGKSGQEYYHPDYGYIEIPFSLLAQVQKEAVEKAQIEKLFIETKYARADERQKIFAKFDQYACIKDDAWYKELKENSAQ